MQSIETSIFKWREIYSLLPSPASNINLNWLLQPVLLSLQIAAVENINWFSF